VNNAIKSQSSEVFIELDELKINKDSNLILIRRITRGNRRTKETITTKIQ